MGYDETKYHLLQHGSEEGGSETSSDSGLPATQKRGGTSGIRATRSSLLLGLALLVSVAANGMLVGLYYHMKTQASLCISPYTGLGLTVEKPYWQHTDYISENRTLADEMWEAIDTSGNTVAFDMDYANSHGLGSSIPFPWDQSKGLYLVRAFHHMHCLKNFRKAFHDALESHPGQPQLIPEEHVMHCLDTMRQDIQCRPDDTPMSSIQQLHKWGDGQVRKCKDWDALVDWTRSPKRHACFKMLSDYRRVPHSLEQFAFCLDDSPYTETMEAYFEEYGHKDPFAFEGDKAATKDEY